MSGVVWQFLTAPSMGLKAESGQAKKKGFCWWANGEFMAVCQ
jgi:hypothetical protein